MSIEIQLWSTTMRLFNEFFTKLPDNKEEDNDLYLQYVEIGIPQITVLRNYPLTNIMFIFCSWKNS